MDAFPPQQPQEVRDRTVVYSVSQGMIVAEEGKEAPFTIVTEPAVIHSFKIHCWVTMISKSRHSLDSDCTLVKEIDITQMLEPLKGMNSNKRK